MGPLQTVILFHLQHRQLYITRDPKFDFLKPNADGRSQAFYSAVSVQARAHHTESRSHPPQVSTVRISPYRKLPIAPRTSDTTKPPHSTRTDKGNGCGETPIFFEGKATASREKGGINAPLLPMVGV